MNKREKFLTALKASYKATFHRSSVLGKMGYLHDELEVVGNAINYMKYSNDRIQIFKTNNQTCLSGIEAFVKKKYVEAYNIFKKIPHDSVEERNYVLAICYLYGKGVKRDKNTGFKLAKEGANFSLCCKELLARCYIEGVGIPANKKKAYDLLIEVLETINTNASSDLDVDYIMPDIFYFCGEYEMENGDDEKALEHLKTAALDKNYGLAYYLLGKYYYTSEPEKAKLYFDKAKILKVNVSTSYYEDERSEVVETPLDMGASDSLDNFSDTLDKIVNIKDSLENLDPELIRKKHYEAKTARINSQIEEKKAKAMSEEIAEKDIETARIQSDTRRIEAESKHEAAELKNKRWKKRNSK